MAIKNKTNTGFTIVELLIVIVVIGILAAITIVAYNGIQNRANDTTVQSDLRNIGTKLAMYRTLEGRYPSNPSELSSQKLKFSTGAYAGVPQETMNVTYCLNGDASEYALFAYSKSRTLYAVDYTNSVKVITGTTNISECGSTGYTRSGIPVPPSTTRPNMDAGYYNGDWRPWTRG